VAFTITHKPNFDDTNARTIHKLRTKHSQLYKHIKTAGGRCWDETDQESLTTYPLCTPTDKKVEESPAHFLGECKALETVREGGSQTTLINTSLHSQYPYVDRRRLPPEGSRPLGGGGRCRQEDEEQGAGRGQGQGRGAQAGSNTGLEGVHSRPGNRDNEEVQGKNETEEPTTRQHPRPPGRGTQGQETNDSFNRGTQGLWIECAANEKNNLSGYCHE